MIESRPRTRLGFGAGLVAGLVLWGIIWVVTGSALLGGVFGMLPGLAIGCGLHLTEKS